MQPHLGLVVEWAIDICATAQQEAGRTRQYLSNHRRETHNNRLEFFLDVVIIAPLRIATDKFAEETGHEKLSS